MGPISVDQWLRENTVNPDVRNLILCYLQPAFGSDGLDMSLLFFLWYIATAGNETNPGTFERSSSTEDGAQDSRFVGGSQLVPLGSPPARVPVALSAPVRRVVQPPTTSSCTTDRGAVRAERVIVVPAVDGARHRLVPAAPGRSGEQLLQRMPMGALMKCDAVYKTPFWRTKGLSGMGLNDQGAVRVMLRQQPAGRRGRRAARVRRRERRGRSTAPSRAPPAAGPCSRASQRSSATRP